MNNLQNDEIIKLADNFNNAAKTYNKSCSLQKKTGQNLIDLCKNYSKKNSNIIDVGCGTGLVTAELYKKLLPNQLIGVDISKTSVKLARKVLRKNNIQFIESDFNKITVESNSQNIIFSNMALHWSLDLYTTLLELHRILAKNGFLAFTIPIEGSFKEMHNSINKFECNPSINTFISKKSVIDSLVRSGFKIEYEESEFIVKKYKNIYDLLKNLKNTGTTFIKQRNTQHLKTKSFFNRLELNYVKNSQNTLNLSYHILYCLSKK